jgi:hypothetical protein
VALGAYQIEHPASTPSGSGWRCRWDPCWGWPGRCWSCWPGRRWVGAGPSHGHARRFRHTVNERPSGWARGLADRDRACYRLHRLAGCPPGQQAAHTGPARSIDRCTATPPGIGGEPAVVPGCRRYPHKAIMLKPPPCTRPRHCGRRVPDPVPGPLALPIRRRRAHDGTPVRLCDAPAGQAGRVRGHVPCRGGDGRAT